MVSPKFNLLRDGDSFEKTGWALFLKDKFPNYDVFWSRFIAPQTRRPVDIWFKDDTPDEVRILCMIHYGIFMHFFFIYSNIHTTDIERFRYSYIKLSSIIDLTEEFLVKWLIFNKKIDPDKLIEQFAHKKYTLSKEDVLKQFKKRNNLSINVESRLNLIKASYNFKEIKQFEKYSSDIKGYRNILIHSWPLFQIGANKVPKKETVINIDFRDWTKIVNKLRVPHESERMINSNFIDMSVLLSEDTESVISCINKMWEYVIADLDLANYKP